MSLIDALNILLLAAGIAAPFIYALLHVRREQKADRSRHRVDQSSGPGATDSHV
jgi:hypothetical protein